MWSQVLLAILLSYHCFLIFASMHNCCNAWKNVSIAKTINYFWKKIGSIIVKSMFLSSYLINHNIIYLICTYTYGPVICPVCYLPQQDQINKTQNQSKYRQARGEKKKNIRKILLEILKKGFYPFLGFLVTQ